MVIISCPGCRAEYDVSLKVLEKQVKCKNCGRSFRAQARKSARKAPAKKPMLWVMVGLAAALFVVVILIVESNIDRGEPEPGPVPEEAAAPGAGSPPPSEEVERGPAKPAVSRSPAERFCVDWIAAVSDNDTDRLQDMINFSLYHNTRSGGSGPLWSDLEKLDQVLKMQEYLDALVADAPEGAAFVRHAAVESTEEISAGDGRAEVAMVLHSMLNDRRQKRIFQLVRIGESWTMASQEVGPEYGGDLDAVAGDAPKTLDQKYKRRFNPEGKIETVPYLPETDESQGKALERLMADLIDGSREDSIDARESLINIGKPAVPALLNGLVPLDYGNHDDIAKANKHIAVLRIVTGKSFGFAPGFQDVAVRGSMKADLTHAVQLWFGWWSRYKDVWEGRDLEKEQQDF